MTSIAPARAFKAAGFAKVARKARISDEALCKAIAQVISGQADDLGGGVYKKRLHANAYRSIVLARAGDFWVYEYLFAKKDRANIDEAELRGFRMLAKAYAGVTAEQVGALLVDEDWIEICRGAAAQETA
ncbi:type II toxin-antitoxin system RelE/ParE family toxin [Novosphingobium sp.]|uniref:type II toxin-antitoxin system RelE/ParE family toxin n=1 Tax=Novosphingobium sp. TaxID=1874826 RepID=UPI00261432AC|nr:type II toxin-antitoxin system RelE/ParE family toxin [Novosphingobium sp.]